VRAFRRWTDLASIERSAARAALVIGIASLRTLARTAALRQHVAAMITPTQSEPRRKLLRSTRAVAPIFSRYVASYGLSDRLRFTAGDFFVADLPRADVLVMGMILHDWDLPAKRMLIDKAHAALEKGGSLGHLTGSSRSSRAW
jgi:O-methyltransferase domain